MVTYWTVRNQRTDATLADRALIAATFWTRAKGLLGRSSLHPGEGLIIIPCASVHMMMMRFAIDVMFVDQHGIVRAVFAALQPGRSARAKGALAAIELPCGVISSSGTQPGDPIVWHKRTGPR